MSDHTVRVLVRLALAACLVAASPVLAQDTECLDSGYPVDIVPPEPDTPGSFSPRTVAFLDFLDTQVADGTGTVGEFENVPICVPFLGTVRRSEVSNSDFVWPDTTTHGTAPEGTAFLEFLRTQELRDRFDELTEAQLVDLLSRFPPRPEPVPGDNRYTLRVTQIVTTNFPDVEVHLKVYAKDIATPTFDAEIGTNLVVTETLVGGEEDQPTQASPEGERFARSADIDPVMMAIVIDGSGSMGSTVTQEVMPAARRYLEWVLNGNSPGGAEDHVSFMVFTGNKDGDGNERNDRIPEDGYGNQGDAGSFLTLYEEVRSRSYGGMSPVYRSMSKELERMVPFQQENCKLQRFLVTMSDFYDNQLTGDSEELIRNAAAQNNSIYLANMMMGIPEYITPESAGFENAEGLAADGRGLVIQNGSFDSDKAFTDLHQGAAYTYVLRYRSAFPQRVNGIVETHLVLPDGSRGGLSYSMSETEGRYALPIVIPEDTRDPKIFFPVSEFFYTRYKGLGSGNLNVTGSFRLRYRHPTGSQSAEEAGIIAPPRTFGDGTPLPISNPDSLLEDDPGHGKGFWIDRENFPTVPVDWNEIFRTPTAPLEDPTGSFYAAEFRFSSGANGSEDCNSLGATPTIRIQDRTPPSVFVELRPATGVRPHRLYFYEHPVDQDPFGGTASSDPETDWMFPDQSDPFTAGARVTEAMVRPPGYGAKTPRVAYRWLDDVDEKIDGNSYEDLLWGLPFNPETEAPPITQVVVKPEQIPFYYPALADPAGDGIPGGLMVNADVRVAITVRARDNFSRLEKYAEGAVPVEDVDVWQPPALEEDKSPAEFPEARPIHAHFNPDRVEFQLLSTAAERQQYPGRIKPPFLPIVPRELLLAAPRPTDGTPASPVASGVAWWIESQVDQDRFHEIEELDHFIYSADEERDRRAPALNTEESLAAALRTLHVLARDAEGNVTRFSIPLYIREADFVARTLEHQTSRVGN